MKKTAGIPKPQHPVSLVLLFLAAIACGPSREAQLELEKAVLDGDPAGVRAALVAGADPSVRVESNIPPLAMTSAEGHLEIVRLLVEAGAELDPDCRPQVICKPLPHAVENGHVEIAELLLAAGADPNSRNPYGDVPLMYALIAEELETARVLLENGADPNLVNQFGMSTFAGTCAMGLAYFVVLQIRHGADLEATHTYNDHESVTPLMRAAAAGHRDVVQILLDAGADPTAEASPRATAETFARDAGHVEIAALLAGRAG